jgi:hypothetical protein
MFVRLISFICSILLFPFSTLFTGYVLSVLWGWFVVPVFHVQQLSIHYAYGLSLLISVLLFSVTSAVLIYNSSDADKKSSVEKSWTHSIAVWVGYGFALLVGWVWHSLGWYM